MNKKIILVLLLICSPCFAGDYVCFDEDGKITERKISIDGYVCGTAMRQDCIKVTRSEILSISQHSLVRDGKISEMTESEKQILDSAERKAREEKESVMTLEKLIAVLKNKEIITSDDVKNAEAYCENCK